MKGLIRQLGAFLILILCVGVFGMSASGATITSTNFKVLDPVVTSGFGSVSSSGFGLGQSFGQQVIGKSVSSHFQVWSGYQYYTRPTQFTLLASSVSNATGTISLAWTTPTIQSGAPITDYEVGIGTSPYSFAFQSVGNVSSYTKTGLTNGVTYYFIVKATTTGGAPIAFSTTTSVIPSRTTPINPGGDGGGGSGKRGGRSSSGTGAVVVSGMAYPNTKVTIIRDGRVVSTVTADPGATFRVTVSDLAAGSYTFGVYAEDTSGLKSPTASFPVTVTESVTATIDNIYLAPTIAVDSQQVKQGDPIGIFGTTAPNAAVTLHVHSAKEFVNNVVAGSTGRWFKQFDTSVLELGNHITFSRSAINNLITGESTTVAFAVGDKTVKADPTYKRSDLNNDGSVNIIDFSMLLYYWYQKPPATSKADINKSGLVDVTDLSIMLYDWTG